MLWTEETIEVLKRLALEGRSARVIAEALGAPSRSAVIGKANRVGIKLNGGGSGAAPGGRPARSERPRASTAPRSKTVSCKQAPAPAPAREPRKPKWIFAGAEVGEMRRIGFDEIRELDCRWPLGDPLSEDFAYCGLQPAPGRSYCAGHCRMAYQAPKAMANRAA
ncbi:MAG TPA: GcrA family cell cycle regulator [Roseiarcus sp.]|nr:GcrA family cell cycle regulator [Roseiarcus sp.]